MGIYAQTFGGVAIAAVFAVLAFSGTVSAGSIFANIASAGYGGEDKIEICHRDKDTLTVAEPAVLAHLAHGDVLGACEV